MTPQFAGHLEFKSPNFFSGSPSAQSSSSVIWHPSSHISLWQLQRTMLCFLNAACCSKLSSSKNGLGSLVLCFKYFFNTSLVGGVVVSPHHPNLKCHHWKKKTKQKRRIQGKRILVLLKTPTAHVPCSTAELVTVTSCGPGTHPLKTRWATQVNNGCLTRFLPFQCLDLHLGHGIWCVCWENERVPTVIAMRFLINDKWAYIHNKGWRVPWLPGVTHCLFIISISPLFLYFILSDINI